MKGNKKVFKGEQVNEENIERPNAFFKFSLYMNTQENFEENYFECPNWTDAAKCLEAMNNKGISCLFMEEDSDGQVKLYY